ncbi:MAG: AAA domain-containing protein [Nostoc sp.]|uniref:AAA domain-containing protein n=1 Tax=Nostoc sp. TaxID=1180 RepID=UPI002FFB841B
MGKNLSNLPTARKCGDRGKRRDNRREAEVVAQLALEHFQRFPEQSLGIIAFSEAQADAIREQIEILGKEYPDLETFCTDNSPQFFLKALENVQGDERDAIILSVGYARDDRDKLSLNFGPLKSARWRTTAQCRCHASKK